MDQWFKKVSPHLLPNVYSSWCRHLFFYVFFGQCVCIDMERMAVDTLVKGRERVGGKLATGWDLNLGRKKCVCRMTLVANHFTKSAPQTLFQVCFTQHLCLPSKRWCFDNTPALVKSNTPVKARLIVGMKWCGALTQNRSGCGVEHSNAPGFVIGGLPISAAWQHCRISC